MDFDFVAEIADLTKVPEQFRGFYAEDPQAAGKYRLRGDDPVVKGSVEALIGLNKALRAERGLTKDLKGKVVDLSPLGDYGKTVEEISASVKAKIDELQAGSGKNKADIEQMRKDITAAHAKEIAAKATAVENLTGQLRTLLVDNAIRQALGDKAIDPDLAMPFVQRFVQAVLDDRGQYQVHVVNEEGAQRHNGATAQPMTIPELVKEMAGTTKYAPLFKSAAPRGSGSSPGAAAGSRPAGDNRRLSPQEKIAAGLAARQS